MRRAVAMVGVVALALGVWLVGDARDGTGPGAATADDPGDPGVAVERSPAAPRAAGGLAAPERSRSERSPATDPAVPALRVVDPEGEPVAGAAVALTPWLASHWASGTEAHLPAIADLEAASTTSTSDREGRAELAADRAVLDAAAFGAVVWAAAPGYRAAARTAPHGATEDLLAGELVLAPAASTTAVVVDGDGRAVAGARIEVRLPALRVYGGDDAPRAVHARSMFFWVGESDAGGACGLPSGSLDGAALADVVLVRAIHGTRASRAVRAAPGDRVVLELEATFQIDGVVRDADDWLTEHAVPPAVVVEREAGAGFERCAAGPLRHDGTFGPLVVPHAAGADYRVWLDGESCEPVEARLVDVAPGDSRSIVLDAVLGWPQWVQVTDARTGEALLAASVVFGWRGAAGPMERRAWLDASQGAVYHLARGLPAGTPLTVTARAEALAPATLDGLELPGSATRIVSIRLAAAAPLRGRVVGLEPPRRDVELLIAPAGAGLATSFHTALDADGAFELADAPAGALWCVAVTPAGGRSSLAAVAEGAERVVELRFREPLVVRGTLVDRDGGEPVLGASATPVLFVGERATPIGRTAWASAAGRFRLDVGPTSPEGRALRVDAPGYVPSVLAVEATGPSVDLGRITLAAELGATLEFYSELDRPAPSAWFSAAGPTAVGRRPLDGDGRVELGALAPGSYSGALELPDEARPRRVGFDVRRAGELLRVPLDGAGSIAVAVPEGDVAAGRRCDLRASTSTFGLVLERPVSASATVVEFGDLPLLDWRVELVDVASGAIHGAAPASLSVATPHRDVTLDPPPTPLWIRVVDESGAPVPSAHVVGRGASATTPAFQARTTGDGLLAHGAATGDDLVLDVVGPAGGAALAIPAGPAVRAQHSSVDEALVIELRTDAAVAARLTDAAGQGLGGVEVAFFTGARTNRLGPAVQSDPSGVARLAGVGPGRALAVVEDPRFVPALQNVEAASAPEPRAMVLYRRSPLHLRVLNADGEPVAGAALSIRFDPFGSHALEPYAWYGLRSEPPGFATDAAGACALAGVPEGRLRITVRSSQAEVEFEVEAIPGDDSPRTLTVDAG